MLRKWCCITYNELKTLNFLSGSVVFLSRKNTSAYQFVLVNMSRSFEFEDEFKVVANLYNR